MEAPILLLALWWLPVWGPESLRFSGTLMTTGVAATPECVLPCFQRTQMGARVTMRWTEAIG
jgi:hypothetical protein